MKTQAPSIALDYTSDPNLLIANGRSGAQRPGLGHGSALDGGQMRTAPRSANTTRPALAYEPVHAALDADYHTLTTLAYRANLSRTGARRGLERLVAAGLAERGMQEPPHYSQYARRAIPVWRRAGGGA